MSSSNGNSKNGEAFSPAKSNAVSSRELTDTIVRLEAIRVQVREYEANEATLQSELTEAQALIAQKQAEVSRLADKAQELRQSQSELEQLLFATAAS